MDVMILVHYEKVHRNGTAQTTQSAELFGPYLSEVKAHEFLRERGWSQILEGSGRFKPTYVRSWWRPIYSRRLTAEIISRPHKSFVQFPNLE